MKTAKTSKRALLCSVLSIALCLSMLIGTTFAWFTDTASTSVNKIQAGKLDVALEMKNPNFGVSGAEDSDKEWVTAEGKTLNFVKAEGHEDEEVLWEPGATYQLPELRVVNNGNLALKYKVTVTGAKDANAENSKDDLILMNVLDWTYSISGNGGATNAASLDTERHLAAKTTDADVFDTLTIQAKMRETAGNEYQGLAIEGIAITVYATQDTVEYDSTGNTYDAKAAYPATTANELQDALTKGGVINVTENLDPEATLTVSGDTKATIDATGKTIANQKDLWDDSTNAWSLISVQEQANLTITGGNFKAKANDCYAIDVQDPGAKLTIKDGNFNGNISAVYVYEGEVTIEGGFFQIQQLASNEGRPYSFLLNCYDANFKNGSAKITVTGGTFVNFNPANTNGEPVNPTSYLPAGYHVVEDVKSATETWYTVVAD